MRCEEHERAENAAVLDPVSFEAEAPDWYPVRGRQRISQHRFSSVRIFVCAAPCSSDGKVPCRSMCPITLEVMTDPVSTADGHVYERSAIEDWLKCAAFKLLSHVCVLC